MDDLPARLRHLPILVVPVNESHDQVSVDYITLAFLWGLLANLGQKAQKNDDRAKNNSVG